MSIRDLSPAELKEKILTYIKREGTVSMEQIWERATGHGVEPRTIEMVITALHRDKKNVQCLSRDNTIFYAIKEPEKPRGPLSHVEWVNNNYPRPGKNGVPPFVMPWPDIDMSWMFLRGEDLERYKCESKGRPYVPGKKPVWERKAKPARELTETQQQLLTLFPV